MADERNDEKLAQLIDRVCSDLPTRCAPAELEQRVLQEIARRAALPWWRRAFAQWPAAARAGFVIVCVLLAGLSLTSGVQSLGGQPLEWVRTIVGLVSTIGGAASLVAGAVPALWIYAFLSVGALFYVLLFGIGAFAYRALYLQHSTTAMIKS